jgi:hypothetical protein
MVAIVSMVSICLGSYLLISSRLSTPAPTPVTYEYVNNVRKTLAAFESAIPASDQISFKDWAASNVQGVLRSVESYSRPDLEHLLELIPSIEQDIYFEL